MRWTRARYDLDVATQVPHAALRVYVMGERGADREPATGRRRRRMARARRRRACAPARSASRPRARSTTRSHGRHIPTLRAEEAELTAIAHAMRDAGSGWLQIVSDFDDPEGEFAMFRAVARESRAADDDHAAAARQPAGGLARRCWLDRRGERRGPARSPRQVAARPTGVLLGFELSQNPFWAGRATRRSPTAVRRARCAPARPRASARRCSPRLRRTATLRARASRWDRMFPLGDPPDYEPKRREQHRRAGRARRPDAGGGRLRPAARA